MHLCLWIESRDHRGHLRDHFESEPFSCWSSLPVLGALGVECLTRLQAFARGRHTKGLTTGTVISPHMTIPQRCASRVSRPHKILHPLLCKVWTSLYFQALSSMNEIAASLSIFIRMACPSLRFVATWNYVSLNFKFQSTCGANYSTVSTDISV